MSFRHHYQNTFAFYYGNIPLCYNFLLGFFREK